MTTEFNFDGLIGPTHNYAGLSYGNIASATHQHQPSSPRSAALQGLQKMKLLSSLGIGQCVLPPLRRPRIELLRQLGFTGKLDFEVIESAYQTDPVLVAVCYSAANMWTANAATVSPSADCEDGRLHLTPANLSSTMHRSLEGPSTTRVLRAIFSDSEFVVHQPLPSAVGMSDEGAANHTRLCDEYSSNALEIFVYGCDASDPANIAPTRFPARQTRLASEAIVRRHQLNPDNVLLWRQTPQAIDAGVFHNDVISVGNKNVLLCHELAFVNQAQCLEAARTRYAERFGSPLHVIEFSKNELPLGDAVRSYLFNSQLVTRPDGRMTMICPIECEEIDSAHRCTQRLVAEDNPVDEVKFINLRQSMNNGGGPACLRLRVVLSGTQATQLHQGIILTDDLAKKLKSWIEDHYRETLEPEDLRDPKLIDESYSALEALAPILELPTDVLLDR